MIDTEEFGSKMDEGVTSSNQQFPDGLRKQLLDKLDEWEEFWLSMDVETVNVQNVSYLNIRLNRSGSPLHLKVAEDGSAFELIAPVFHNFPKEASHFVLADLSFNNALWRFCLAEELSGEGEQPRAKGEVLCAWAPLDVETFLTSDSVFLPNLIAKLDEAEVCVKAHIDGKPVPEGRLIA